jgi:hypothetical protein
MSIISIRYACTVSLTPRPSTNPLLLEPFSAILYFLPTNRSPKGICKMQCRMKAKGQFEIEIVKL